jgi:hypothetical protein
MPAERPRQVFRFRRLSHPAYDKIAPRNDFTLREG